MKVAGKFFKGTLYLCVRRMSNYTKKLPLFERMGFSDAARVRLAGGGGIVQGSAYE